MDFNTAHDIVHEEAGNSSERCPFCNGAMEKKDVEGAAGNIIKAQRNNRARPMNTGMHLWGEEEAKASDKNKEGNKTMSYVPSYDAVRQPLMVYPLTQITAGEKGNIPAEIQIMPIGAWDTVPYGHLEITKEDVLEMVKHFKNKVRAGDTLPIDVDHDGKEAAGWMTDLLVKEDGLYASVDWTDLGRKLLGEKRYKFFSPEFNPDYINPENENEKLNNVLIAGSLVNRPLFKELKPLMASEGLTENRSGAMLYVETMNLKELIKRKQAGESLTAAEETFLKQNGYTADDQNDGKKKGPADSDGDTFKKGGKKEGDDDGDTDGDAPEGKKKDDAKKGHEESVSISASEYQALKRSADRGVEVAEKLEAKEISEKVESWTFSEKGGHFQPAIKNDVASFYKELNDKQRKTFSELMEKFPTQKALFNEYGSDNAITKNQAADDVTARARALQASEKENGRKMTFSAAVKKVIIDNPELQDYDLMVQKGKIASTER